MDVLLLASLILLLTGLPILVQNLAERIRKTKPEIPAPHNHVWPRVALIVPATGRDAGLNNSIRSLLAQDYPHYKAILVTRSLEDPAASLILQMIQHYPHAQHVVSGRADSCGQKNHNLLAGLQHISEKDEILVFCDSSRRAPSGWLKHLVQPIVQEGSAVTTGYHQVIPQDHRIPTLGHAVSVQILGLTKRIRRLNQTWGGATAIERKTFESLEVEQVWSRNVVDDVSLAAVIKRSRIQLRNVRDASLSTPLARETFPNWNRWLFRQWFYLKFCFPGTWILGGILCHLHAALVLFAGSRCVAAMLGYVQAPKGLSATLFLLLLTAMGFLLRRIHSQPGPWLPWLAACYANFFMASWSHLCTIFSSEIPWRGIRYRVTRGGRVTAITEE